MKRMGMAFCARAAPESGSRTPTHRVPFIISANRRKVNSVQRTDCNPGVPDRAQKNRPRSMTLRGR